VHTNAAYSRLTGIDSHSVVGKPITALLSIPDNLITDSGTSNNNEAHQPPDETTSAGPAASRDAADQLAAAAAAGRARASQQNQRSVGLERLVAASGFGRLHVMQVHSKPHQMMGKNVTVVQNDSAPRPGPRAGGSLSQNPEDGSNDASLTSSGYENSRRGDVFTLKCRSSIAPVVSTPSAVESFSVVSDRDATAHHNAKRRKVNEHEAHGRKPKELVNHRRHHINLRQVITHYVIQLQPQEHATKQGSEESLSSNSTSVEARLLGLTKVELQKQRLAVGAALAQDQEVQPDDGIGSETTDTREPVSAIG